MHQAKLSKLNYLCELYAWKFAVNSGVLWVGRLTRLSKLLADPRLLAFAASAFYLFSVCSLKGKCYQIVDTFFGQKPVPGPLIIFAPTWGIYFFNTLQYFFTLWWRIYKQINDMPNLFDFMNIFPKNFMSA